VNTQIHVSDVNLNTNMEEVMGRGGRRRKQLFDDLKRRKGYGKLKEEVLDSTLWRKCF
jgi:hypothetical protein